MLLITLDANGVIKHYSHGLVKAFHIHIVLGGIWWLKIRIKTRFLL